MRIDSPALNTKANGCAPLNTVLPWLAGALLVVGFSKGVVFAIQAWQEPYIYLTYHDGVVKRGLLGTLLAFIFGEAQPERMKTAMLELHFLLCVGLMLIMADFAQRALFLPHSGGSESVDTCTQSGRGLWPIVFLLAAAPFWPTLAMNPGFLDAPSYVLFALAFRATIRGGWKMPVMLAAIAPFLHESAVFVWSPLMVLAAWEMWRAQRILPHFLAPLMVLGLSTAAIFVLHNQEAAVLQINAAPLTAAVKEEIITIQMGQTLPSTLRHMAATWAQWRGNGLLCLSLFALPTVLAIGAYAAIRRLRWEEVGVLLLATLLPLLILCVAWDLSRFIVYTNFAAGLAIAYWEFRIRPVVRQNRCMGWVLSPVTVLSALSPLVYAYFSGAYVYDNGLLPMTRTPVGAGIKQWFEGAYWGRVEAPAAGDDGENQPEKFNVHGPDFEAAYRRLSAGVQGVLGKPTAPAVDVGGGTWRRDYQGGQIFWRSGPGFMPVYGLIGAKWLEFGGERGVFGSPITGEIAAPALKGGRVTHFERGSIYWSPTHGIMPLYGFIGTEWRLLGGENSSLGLPVSGEEDDPNVPGGRRTRFQWGTISWHPDTGATVKN